MKRLLKNSKINWRSSFYAPGFYLLLSLGCISVTFIILQTTTFSQVIVGIIFLSFFFLLLIYKFSEYRPLIFVFLGLVGIVSFVHQKPKELNLEGPIQIYSDQIQIKDNFFYGEGKLGKNKVLISGSIDNSFEKKLNKYHTCYLVDYRAKVEQIMPATNPGEFDYQKYYRSKKIRERVKLENYQIYPKKITIFDYIHVLRKNLMNYFEKMPSLTKFFASEMVLAQNPSPDNEVLLNSYRDLGIIHLLSISGLHVSLYILGIMWLGTILKRTEEEVTIFCIAFLTIEILLANFQAGFVRASLSYFWSIFFKRKKMMVSSGDKLGIVVLTHLLFNPLLFLNSGAILSYLLVFGLEITQNFKNIKQNLALNLLITPILLHSFYRINILKIIYNFLIVPIFNFVLLPLTFIVIFLFWLLPAIGKVSEPIFKVVADITNFIADKQLGLVTFGQINWFQTIFLLVITITLIILPKIKIKKLKLRFFLVGTYVSLFCLIHFPLKGQVSFIDVGQGDSILITTPFNRKTYLIDTGGKLNFGKRKSQPQLNRITIPYLYSQGINHLDGVFLSHQDADHIGDLTALLDQISVDKLYFAKGLTENQSFMKRINNHVNDVQLVPLLAGDEVKTKNINFEVVYPFEPGLGKNEDSLSLTFKLANKRWLFTGDLGRDGEKEILSHYNLHVDYFKLGHHGSKTSSDPEFLKQLDPHLVFISSGRNNRFGHPHQETLKTLKDLSIPYLNTQDSGTITWTYSPFQGEAITTFYKGNVK